MCVGYYMLLVICSDLLFDSFDSSDKVEILPFFSLCVYVFDLSVCQLD
jgi:hypothetical protein